MSTTTTTTTSAINITEVPQSLVAKETKHETETLQTPNGDTIFSTSTSTKTTTTTQTSIENTEPNNNNNNNANTNTNGDTSNRADIKTTDENANATTTTTTSVNAAATNGHQTKNGIGSVEDLKIVGHLKSIEQINEKRRLFLSNTISEQTTAAATTTTTTAEISKVEKSKKSSSKSSNNKSSDQNDNHIDNTKDQQAHGTSVAQETTKESEQTTKHSNVNGKNNRNSNNSSDNYGGKIATAHIASPDDFDLTPTTLQYATLPLVRTPPPSTPPPKPPMLSRTRSLNRGPSTSSTPPQTPLTPVNRAATSIVESDDNAAIAKTPTTPSSTVTIVSTVVAQPLKVETIELRELQAPKAKATGSKVDAEALKLAAEGPKLQGEGLKLSAEGQKLPEPSSEPKQENDADDLAALRKTVQPVVPVPPTAPAQMAADKPIATSHYERLIEELKCPGCATPMKAPVLLCRTGHSSCEQCTRVLMMCPLCREPFTDLRSLTVEALCSKAHFRCANAAGGCTVRLHLDLLGWHEKQCIFKPMKCFMGRVWGDCQWSGREAYWKDHLMAEHGNKVFSTDTIDLIWNMGVKQKPLTGYYVFEVFDEMFNFYEIFDKERVLFTMTVTSTVKDKKYNFAYEVTMLDRDSDALAFTQKFPVHSEYDNDILQDGTCVSVPLTDLAKFIDEDRLLHYRIRITEVKTPRKMKLAVRHSCPPNGHQADYQQTRIEGVNLKNVPTDVIVTRKFGEGVATSSKASPNLSTERGGASSSEDEIERIRRQYYNRHNSDSESDPELDAFIAKRWGTPQLHFNRKYLRNVPSDISSSEDGMSQQKNGDTLGLLADQRKVPDDRASISSTATNYRKRMTNSLRRSMRTLRVDFKALTSKKPSSVDKQQPETA